MKALINISCFAAAIAFCFASCESVRVSDQPKTCRTIPQAELTLLNSEYKIAATPSKEIYKEGEQVFVRVAIEILVDSPRTRLNWNYAEKQLFFIEPLRAGQSLGLIEPAKSVRPTLPPFDATDPTWFSPNGGWAQLTPGYLDAASREYKGNYGFTPGKFRAFVDLGVVSSWIKFEVQEASPTEIARRGLLDHKIGKKKDVFELRSVLATMDTLFALDSSEPLCCEALRDGIDYLIYFDFERNDMPDFTSADSLHIISVASDFCKTCPMHSYNDIHVQSLIANLMTRRGNDWLGNESYGAYLYELGDSTLMHNYVNWSRVYRRNETLGPHLPLRP